MARQPSGAGAGSADGVGEIVVTGAREHNLKSIDVVLPRNKLVVVTGLSGSGKSSLAFDTIYAEGQRRYVESLSAYARQFLELMQKPDVDSIEGLSPAISIEQKTTSRNPRSTVGTVTEIYDYLRLLFARVGVPYSPATGLPIESQTVSQMVDLVMAMPEKTRLYLLAPIVQRPQGRVPQGARRAAQARLPAGQDRRQSSPRSRTPRPWTRSASTTSRWWSTASWSAPASRRAWPRASRPRSTWPTAWSSPRTLTAARASGDLLGPLRLPGLRLHHRRDRAAAVLLQLAPSAPARPATVSASPSSSIPSWSCRMRVKSLHDGVDRALGRLLLAVLQPDPRLAGAPLQDLDPSRPGRS